MSADGQHFVSCFDACEAELRGASPDWLAQVRRAAIELFDDLGMPNRKNEAWKYTSAAPIAAAELDPAPVESRGISRDDLRALFGDEAIECCLVFEDGRYAPGLSSASGLVDEVIATNLTQVWSQSPEDVRSLLAADGADRPFEALNRAFHCDGAYLSVAAGVRCERPIEFLFVATPDAAGRVASPRNLIRVAAGATVAVSMRFGSLCEDVYLTNAVTQIEVGDNAELDLTSVQEEGTRAFHLASFDISQGRDSRFRSHHIALGGALARNEINCRLNAPGTDCSLDGLFVVNGEQHVDNQTLIDHAQPHGTSRELYKGVLDGRSRGVFNGLILVRPNAQKTNAQQSNPNLLLSDRAHINTKPTLEIRADDVKCTHGSTIGRLDENAVFYLRARGIDERQAKEILTGAFAADVADAIPSASIRDHVKQRIAAKLGTAR